MSDDRERPGDGPDRPAPRRTSDVPSPGEYAGLGVQFIAVIGVFLYAGLWLDKKLGTSPWLLLLGVLVGMAAGFYNLYHRLTAGQRRR